MAYSYLSAGTLVLALSRLLVGCGDSEGGVDGSGPYATKVLDLRGFDHFTINQVSWPTGCPVPFLPAVAEIRRIADRRFELTYSAAFASEEDFDECVRNESLPRQCELVKPTPGVPRLLDETDMEELLELFAVVPVNFAANSFCSEDPCNPLTLVWDDTLVGDVNCECCVPWVSNAVSFEILSLVDALRTPTR